MSTEQDLQTLKQQTQQIWQQVSKDESTFRQALSLASDVIGVISVVGLPAAVISFLDFINKHDPLEDDLAPIETLLKITFSFEQSEADLTQMQSCTALATQAQSRLQSTLQENLPYSTETLDATQTVTLTVANTLEADPLWRRVFFKELAHSDYWSGVVMPPGSEVTTLRPDRSFVFDYRLALPCYLSAIATRHQALVLLLGSGFVRREAVIQEIANRARTLETFYKRILAGFTKTRTPDFFPDIQYQDISIPPGQHPLIVSRWDPVPPGPNRIFGIIDSYVGDGVLASYPSQLFPNRDVGPFIPTFPLPLPVEYLQFTTRYALGVEKRRKELYALIRLDLVWETVQALKEDSGQPAEQFDRNLFWSLRDIIGDIAELPFRQSSLFEVVKTLADIGKVDNSQVFLVSWREALDACMV